MTPDENKARIARIKEEEAAFTKQVVLLYRAYRKQGMTPDPEWEQRGRAEAVARYMYAKEHGLNPDTGQPLAEHDSWKIAFGLGDSVRKENARRDRIPYVTPAPGAVIHAHTRKRGIRPRLK
jgi:hypothetical protein